MTSSNGNIFRVTGPLCGEFTGPGEFPTQRPATRSFDVFLDLRLNKRLSKQPWGWWFETPSWSLWRHCNVIWHGLLLCKVIWYQISITHINAYHIWLAYQHFIILGHLALTRMRALHVWHGVMQHETVDSLHWLVCLCNRFYVIVYNDTSKAGSKWTTIWNENRSIPDTEFCVFCNFPFW